jgi:hypothetical protein
LKLISIAVVATAVVGLSGCVASSNGSAGTSNDQVVSTTGTMTEAPAAPKFTVAQEQAIQSAQSYVDMSGFSRTGLIHQLTSKAGEGFKPADAAFAVNHIKVDWNKEAVESAKSYLEMGGFSRASLIRQLSSKSGEQFTRAQAKYAANHVGL